MAVVEGQIRCSVCGERKPTAEFAPSRVEAGNGPCRPCKAARGRACYAANPEKVAARCAKYRAGNIASVREGNARYRKANRRKKREQALRAAYGMSLADFERMAEAQGGKCACCGEAPQRLVVDHDHSSGAVRGLLCSPCNSGLGQFRDDEGRLSSAVRYLAQHRPKRREAA